MAAPITSEGGATEIGALLSSSLPAWTRIDLDEYKNNRPWLARCFGSHGAISRQDSLYWMERKGPKLYLILFQIQLIFTSAYISLLLLSFLPHMYQESSTMGYSRLALYVVVSLLPIYLALSKHQTAAANMTMASSIGVHRRPRAVAQVIREEKTDRIICAMVTMQKLQHAARTGFASSSSPPQDTTPTDHSRPHTVALNKVAKTFDALDSSGDGTIGNQELKQVLSALGAPATDESLQAMIRLLDHNQDGHISKDEFLAFYSANIILEVDHHGLHELAREMFQQFDQDNSGEITLGEFKEVLEAFNVGFTVDEIGDLVNELDEEDDGTIGEHEFFKLLEKHRYLFKKHSLPPLE
jgi:Ca2+-binding EF-hand superfamily protein